MRSPLSSMGTLFLAHLRGIDLPSHLLSSQVKVHRSHGRRGELREKQIRGGYPNMVREIIHCCLSSNPVHVEDQSSIDIVASGARHVRGSPADDQVDSHSETKGP